jgi:hypothetical protein
LRGSRGSEARDGYEYLSRIDEGVDANADAYLSAVLSLQALTMVLPMPAMVRPELA